MKTFVMESNDGNRLFIITSDDIESARNQLNDKISNFPTNYSHRELSINDIIDITFTDTYDDGANFDVTWLSNNNVYVGVMFKYYHPQHGLHDWIVDSENINLDLWCVKSSCNKFSFDAPTELIKYCLR